MLENFIIYLNLKVTSYEGGCRPKMAIPRGSPAATRTDKRIPRLFPVVNCTASVSRLLHGSSRFPLRQLYPFFGFPPDTSC